MDRSELGAELYGLSIHIHKCWGKSECMKTYYAMSAMKMENQRLVKAEPLEETKLLYMKITLTGSRYTKENLFQALPVHIAGL